MARPEPMNATAQHAKVKATIQFSDPRFVAGQDITGKFELECRTEKGLAIGVVKAELLAIQELASRDHSASNTFIHQVRSFQGPLLPPSNAVYAHPQPGSDPLPDDYYPARKGTTTFFFRFPTPRTTPASIDFGKGLAKLRYDVRTTVGVYWKDDRQLVTDRKEIEVLEYPGEPSQNMEQVVVGENGKLWAQARILNSYMVSSQSACVELFVKNHSMKKTSSLSLSLTRHLRLDAAARPNKILQISDTVLNMPFKGPEYIVRPGTEGVANLVFTIPKAGRGVRSGPIYLEDGDRIDEMSSLFHVQCLLTIKIGMGLGSKDVNVELPINIVHPSSLVTYGIQEPQISPPLSPLPPAQDVHEQYYSSAPYSPNLYSPPPEVYHHNLLTPPFSPPLPQQALFWSPPATPILEYANPYYHPMIPFTTPPRPVSADPYSAHLLPAMPLTTLGSQNPPVSPQSDISNEDGEVGKGERASRISARLHRSSRNRSVSPLSHRFPHQQSPSYLLQPQQASALGDGSLDSSQALTRASLSPRHAVHNPSADNVLHAPRPMLSPKHSFVLEKGGTGKSLRVEELEKMAEKELTEIIPAQNAEDENSDQGHENNTSSISSPSPPELPRLAPVRPRLSYRNGASGLDALERRLMQQVGTKKPSSDRRADVRTIIPPAIEIPPHTDEQVDPPNDSAISSLALEEDEVKEAERPSEATVRPRKTTNPVQQPQGEKTKDREKRVEVQQLRKAATSRVAAWLDTIDPSATPAPAAISLLMHSTNSTETERDGNATPVNANPNSFTVTEREEHVTKVPTTSSGFVLRRSENENEAFVEPTKESSATVNLHPVPTSNSRTQEAISSPSSPPERVTALSPKSVFKRYAYGQDVLVSKEAKYPVQSARGGRGGKVTSVAAIWSSLAEGNDQRKVSNGSSEENSSVAVHSPSPIQVPRNVNPTPKKSLNLIHPNTNPVDRKTSPRPAFVKSASVPAAISSSVARPLLSSTASLARPPSSTKKIYPPSVTSNNSSSDTQPGKVPKLPAPAGGEMAFGQARLKDLIRKYQQGV